MPVEFWSNLICLWPWMCLAFWSAQTGSNDTGFAWVGGQLDLQLSTDTRLLQADNPPIPKFVIDAPAKRFKEVRLVQSVKRAIYGPGSPGTNVVYYWYIIVCWMIHRLVFSWSAVSMFRQSQTARPRHFRGEIMNQHIQCFRPKHKFDFIMTIIVSLRYVPRATN